eukprot:gene7619-3642_t
MIPAVLWMATAAIVAPASNASLSDATCGDIVSNRGTTDCCLLKSSLDAKSAEDCRRLCLETADCLAWSYNKPWKIPGSAKIGIAADTDVDSGLCTRIPPPPPAYGKACPLDPNGCKWLAPPCTVESSEIPDVEFVQLAPNKTFYPFKGFVDLAGIKFTAGELYGGSIQTPAPVLCAFPNTHDGKPNSWILAANDRSGGPNAGNYFKMVEVELSLLQRTANNQGLMEPSISSMWALREYTATNGATRVVPGSHTWPRYRAPEHGAGANKSQMTRWAMNIDYSVAWLRQEENQYLSCPPSIAKRMPLVMQKLIGYSQAGMSMGYWDNGKEPSPEAYAAMKKPIDWARQKKANEIEMHLT